MNKIVCDICGKTLSQSNKYLLPLYQNWYAKSGRGNTIARFVATKVQKCSVDLCNDCEDQIAKAFYNAGILY